MERNKKLKIVEVLLCGVIAFAALCALAIPAAANTFDGSSNFYNSLYGWSSIKFGVNGDFDIVSVPTVAYPSSGSQTLYDRNGVMLVCQMTDSYWLRFTIVNNNLNTVTISLTILMDSFQSISVTSGYEEGFLNSGDYPSNDGVLSTKTRNLDIVTGSSNQGWSYQTSAVDDEISCKSWSLYSVTRKNLINDQVQNTNSEIKGTFSIISNMPSRVYWSFRLRAKNVNTSIPELVNAIPQQIPYDPVVQVENVDFSSVGSFLNSSVGSFFSFPIFPGVTVGGIFAVLLSVLVVVIFLKMFAGG